MLDVVRNDGELMLASWNNVLVNEWRGRVTAELLHAIEPLQKHMIAAYPGGYGSLAIISSASLSLDDNARKEAGRLARASQHVLKANAHLVEGAGFRLSVIRSVITAVHAVTAQTTGTKVFSTLTKTCKWLVETIQPVTAVRLDAVVLEREIVRARAARS